MSWKNKILKAIARIVIVISVVLVAVWIYIAQPTTRKNSKSLQVVDVVRLKTHVSALSKDLSPRNYKAIDNLNKCADYIYDNFSKAGAVAERQEFEVNG